MCGITGFYNPSGFHSHEAEATLVEMRNRLVHRGPDDAGTWLDSDAGIALGHRRLSILDLSAAGHQPMQSLTGRYVIIFNGEIYNHLDIRRKLESIGRREWVGHSDTETLLMSIEQWGIDLTLKDAVGMFALAVWDRKHRSLTLTRDRLGEKPLYYGWQNGVLLFGSELKSLVVHPSFCRRIDHDVLPIYLRHGYIPAPWSIWKGIRKLMPGTLVKFSASKKEEMPEPTPYWSMQEAIEHGQANPFVGSDSEAIDTLEKHLSEAIAGQRLSDVPLGAFLSGGVDSSTVVALMQAQSSQRVKTFTIGFKEPKYNEAEYAKSVANHLGTDHTELYVTSNQARDVIPQLAEMYDEPFGDSSAIPTHLVSQLARQHVTVSLSGDGGDELFGGYDRYFKHRAEAIWYTGRKIPSFIHPMLHNVFNSSLPEYADKILHLLMRLVNRPLNKSIEAKFLEISKLLKCKTDFEYYQTITSQWNPAPVRSFSYNLNYGYNETFLSSIPGKVQRMMAQDSVTYLPDDILVKVDRAAMAVSLETRVPLLDHRVVELALQLPYNLKVRDRQGKWILREVLYRHVPRNLFERPKMGFGVPVDQWLCGPLREWTDELIAPKRLESEGYLNSEAILHCWKQHLKGRHNWRDRLWSVIMWQAWLEKYND